MSDVMESLLCVFRVNVWTVVSGVYKLSQTRGEGSENKRATLNLRADSHKGVIYATEINHLHGNVDGGHENKHTHEDEEIGFSCWVAKILINSRSLGSH